MRHLITIIFCFILSFYAFSQVHVANTCLGDSYTMKWSDTSWATGSTGSKTISDVDGSGKDVTISMTGALNTLDEHPTSTSMTPQLSDWGNTDYSGDHFVLATSGLGTNKITLTIEFSEEVENPAFTINHVNFGGSGGDNITVRGKTAENINNHPVLNSDATCTDVSHTLDGNKADGTSYEAGGNCDAVGVVFSGSVKRIIIVWKENTASTGGYHAISIGDIDFCESLILPIELGDYKILKDVDKNIVSWETLSEMNNDYFEILSKTNGDSEFNVIGKVDGNVNSMKTIEYQFEDTDIKSGNTLYKLVQYDLDGTRTDHGIRSIHRDELSLETINVFPNPTTDYIYLKGLSDNNEYCIKLFKNGRLVLTANSDRIDMSPYSNGMYTVAVYKSGILHQTERVMKN